LLQYRRWFIRHAFGMPEVGGSIIRGLQLFGRKWGPAPELCSKHTYATKKRGGPFRSRLEPEKCVGSLSGCTPTMPAYKAQPEQRAAQKGERHRFRHLGRELLAAGYRRTRRSGRGGQLIQGGAIGGPCADKRHLDPIKRIRRANRTKGESGANSSQSKFGPAIVAITGGRWFESGSLQQRVCEPSVPLWGTSGGDAGPPKLMSPPRPAARQR
jgi:hypothetical protein